MIPVLLTERAALFNGDSAGLGTVLQPDSVDAIVCDPPAGISFMGKKWDGDHGGRDQWVAWLAATLAPAFVALKPGGHALVWAIPRTSHWTALALELAGFEIRDVHHHLFGTGFPKSLTSASAEIPDGTGTALKPAAEHWILARKPLAGTVAANFAEHGTGLLQIDACRIGTDGGGTTCGKRDTEGNCLGHGNSMSQSGETFHHKLDKLVRPPVNRTDNIAFGTGLGAGTQVEPIGRWPAHVSLDEYAAEALDAQSGTLKSGRLGVGHASGNTFGVGNTDKKPNKIAKEYGNDSGGASRFFYIAKGSRAEKDAGLEHLPVKSGGEATGRADDSAGVANPRAGAGRTGGARNHHPTVKSIALMRWLCRLITPPGGTVLDPFAGSGTTGCAALAEGFDFVGVELDKEYVEIAKGRILHALK